MCVSCRSHHSLVQFLKMIFGCSICFSLQIQFKILHTEPKAAVISPFSISDHNSASVCTLSCREAALPWVPLCLRLVLPWNVPVLCWRFLPSFSTFSISPLFSSLRFLLLFLPFLCPLTSSYNSLPEVPVTTPSVQSSVLSQVSVQYFYFLRALILVLTTKIKQFCFYSFSQSIVLIIICNMILMSVFAQCFSCSMIAQPSSQGSILHKFFVG